MGYNDLAAQLIYQAGNNADNAVSCEDTNLGLEGVTFFKPGLAAGAA